MPQTPVAMLAGTQRQPEVRLTFDRDAIHPTRKEPLVDWVKRAPRRHWDRNESEWVITAFGGKDNKAWSPERILRRAGFQIVTEHPGLHESLRDVLSLDDLVDPVCRQSRKKPGLALVRPRFAGWDVTRDILGMAASWNKEEQWFEVPLTELLRHGDPKRGLIIDPATVEAARAALLRSHSFGSDEHDDETLSAAASEMAASTGLDLTDAHTEQFDQLVKVVGDVPDWFGLDLYPYQRLGAVAALAGRNFIADPTGLGKTRQALAVLAIKDVDRGVIVVPPVVLTNWARECIASGLAIEKPKPLTKAELKRREKAAKQAAIDAAIAAGMDPAMANRITFARPKKAAAAAAEPATPVDEGPPPRYVTMFRATRKEPELPERGIVIVPDSLISGRPALREKIAAWGPEVVVYDEAHRARTWTSDRAKAMRELREILPADSLMLPMTATPLFSNPAELASLLALSGHLDPIFGGYSAFVERFCKRNHFKALVARKEELPALRKILAEQVWVRRRKKEVLKDLPKVSLQAKFLDVDLAGFRAAHDEVIEKICLWLDEWQEIAREEAEEARREGREPVMEEYPFEKDIKVFSRTQIGLMSPLRKAAGVAKVPAALDTISDWINDEAVVSSDGTVHCERPLLVWVHHHEVVDAILEHISSHLKESARKMVGVIAGATSADRRGYFVDEFQAGRLPVLIASISAAGVGITLTHGSDQVFVESSYSVPEVSQAIDRQNRIGQKNPVMVTTLLAEGTLDAHIQKILNGKSEIIEAVLGEDGAAVSIVSNDDLDDLAGPAEIIEGLVHFAIEVHRKEKAAGKRPALQSA